MYSGSTNRFQRISIPLPWVRREQEPWSHHSSPEALEAFTLQGGWLGRTLVRPSSEHIQIVRAPGTQGMASHPPPLL